MSDTKALDHFFDNCNWQYGGEGQGDWEYEGGIDPQQAAAELKELRKANDVLIMDENDRPVHLWQLVKENTQLRAEVDKYDLICTAVRNELTNAGVPELTDDRLAVVSLVARVALLRANRDIRQSELDEAIRVMEPLTYGLSFIDSDDEPSHVEIFVPNLKRANAFLERMKEPK